MSAKPTQLQPAQPPVIPTWNVQRAVLDRPPTDRPLNNTSSIDMKTLLSSLALLANVAWANPIATPPVKEATIKKTWEKCLISAGTKSATVSCAVGYVAKNFLEYPVYISVPVFLPAGIETDPAKLKNTLKPRLETGGKVLEPIWISAGGHSTAKGMAECRFEIGHVPDKAFSIVVSYEQPAIDGRIYYLPLFEGGKSPMIGDDFTVTFFPTNGAALSLESQHRNKVTALRTRITIHPLHNETIKVATAKS